MLKTIKLNKLTNIIVDPRCVDPKRVLNSPCNVVVILDHNKDQREGIAQYNIGINKIPRKVDNQFKDMEKILDVGSNTENKLVIIFNLFLFLKGAYSFVQF